MIRHRACLLALVIGANAAACVEQGEIPAVDYREPPSAEAGAGLVHVVVEIPAGTNAKWEVDKTTGTLVWEQEDGAPRVVDYLAYPGNYGMIPGTLLATELGGDGDPLDVIVLGPALERGAVVEARPVGVLRLIDGGERDDKILATPSTGPFASVTDLADLDRRYPGATAIVETWFLHYKERGEIVSEGFGSAEEAWDIIDEARGVPVGTEAP